MYEKYLKVVSRSNIENLMNNVVEANKAWRELAKKFCEDFGIESEEMGVSETLIIPLTEKDKEKYGDQVTKDGKTFRKNSKLQKEYTKRFVGAGLNKMRLRLYIWDYNIPGYGRHSIQKFKYGDNWYIKFVTQDDYKVPDDYEEIKASEYFKMLEEIESKNK